MIKNNYAVSLMTGIDIPIQECQIVLHQPTIKEIAFMTEDKFFEAIQCLLVNKNSIQQDETVLAEINNFQIFMTILQEKKAADKKEAVQQTLSLLFPKKQILFTPNSLLLNEKEQSPIIIDVNNFENLQEILRHIFCVTIGPMDQQAFNPGGDKAREIAKKLQRGRERIAAEKGSSNASTLSQYLSILAVGLQQPIESMINLTMFQLYDLVERYHLWIAWDLDVRSRLAGGKPDSKPDNWMKNIHTN